MTWTISYERMRQIDGTAATFLQLWAYLDHQDVWYELISRGSKSCRECKWLQEMAESEIHFKRVQVFACEVSFPAVSFLDVPFLIC